VSEGINPSMISGNLAMAIPVITSPKNHVINFAVIDLYAELHSAVSSQIVILFLAD